MDWRRPSGLFRQWRSKTPKVRTGEILNKFAEKGLIVPVKEEQKKVGKKFTAPLLFVLLQLYWPKKRSFSIVIPGTTQLVNLLAAHDIPIYGDPSALVTFEPTELKISVLDNDNFQFYLVSADSPTDLSLDQIYRSFT